MTDTEGVEDILKFWFGADGGDPLANSGLWFGADADFDREIAARFGAAVARALAGELEHWRRRPRTALAYLLLTDQFPRNLYREDGRAFLGDALALACCLAGLERGLESRLSLVEQWFFLMPLMHAEDMACQNRSMARFLSLAEAAQALQEGGDPQGPALHHALSGALVFAAKHREVIARFGRFPHRNAVLGRTDTPEEAAFLAEHGRGF